MLKDVILNMKRIMRMVMMAAVGVMMAGCINEDMKGADLKVGDEVPGFEVRMSDGSVVSDVSLKGSVSVIMFFHTACPDCRNTLPVVQRIYDEYSQKGVRFAVISREEGDDVLGGYWSENGLEMPYSAQKDRSVYELFARVRIPRIYINDRNGIIRHIFTDNPVPSYDDLKSALDSSDTIR